ncbi:MULTISPECIES: terminase small subunit [unclassified Nitrosovibrio]
MELTLKQQRFAAEYCLDLNDTAAYRCAGYSA